MSDEQDIARWLWAREERRFEAHLDSQYHIGDDLEAQVTLSLSEPGNDDVPERPEHVVYYHEFYGTSFAEALKQAAAWCREQKEKTGD